ncbi:MAG: hypothetical protein AAGC55_22845, partial [Myxococcota bacterium]
MTADRAPEQQSTWLRDIWSGSASGFVEPLADVYRLPLGRAWRSDARVSWYPSEWDEMPPPSCYFNHEIEAEGILMRRALDLALGQSPLVVVEALAGSGKSVAMRTLCAERRNMVYIDCPSEARLWMRVHTLSRSAPKETIFVLDSFDDTSTLALSDDVVRLAAMVYERNTRIIIVTRPFAIDGLDRVAEAPRVFLRSTADPAEPGWQSWLRLWNRAAPGSELDEAEIATRQVGDLVAVPLVHQLFALTREQVVARYRYEDSELVDALATDILQVFFAGYSPGESELALDEAQRMRLLGRIAWELHTGEVLSRESLPGLYQHVRAGAASASDDDSAQTLERLTTEFDHILRLDGDGVSFRQRT